MEEKIEKKDEKKDASVKDAKKKASFASLSEMGFSAADKFARAAGLEEDE